MCEPCRGARHFGGGTAMALRYGEYRESMDVDFWISDLAGYRDLRQMTGNERGFLPIAHEGIEVELAREVRADQYGIRAQVRSGESTIKFEIMLAARIELAAEKLLANADRWADDSVRSSLSQSVDALETRRGRLEACMTALSIDGVTRAQLWQAIQKVARQLLA